MGGIIVERGWLTRLICSLSSRKLSCGYMYCSYSWHKPLSKRQIVRDKLFVLLKRTRQGWEFTLSLIRSFPQNRSFLRATVSDSLFKKSDVNDSVVIRANRSIKKFVFFLCFWQFFPLLCLRANHSRLFFKERHEGFAQVAQDKRATGAIRSFSRANRSFAHKNRANCSKNPGTMYTMVCTRHHKISLCSKQR